MSDLERRHGEWFAAVSDAAYDDVYQQWMPTELVGRLGEDQRKSRADRRTTTQRIRRTAQSERW